MYDMGCNNCLQEIISGEDFYEDDAEGTKYHVNCKKAAIDRRDKAEARVAELQAALAAERAWSSASEPPEESGDYIGYDGKSVMCVRFDAHEDADEDWPWADMDGTFVPVTRWQVLPPAPQEPR